MTNMYDARRPVDVVVSRGMPFCFVSSFLHSTCADHGNFPGDAVPQVSDALVVFGVFVYKFLSILRADL